MKKKIILSVAAVVFAAALMPVSAYRYPLCDVEGCNAVGIHKHGDNYYCSHSPNNGERCRQICPVEGCTETKWHEHDGVFYLPKNAADQQRHNHGRHGGKWHHR